MKRRYLEARYDLADLNEAQIDVLSGEATMIAERSDRGGGDDHPDVRVELDVTSIEVCEDCGKEIPEGESVCDSCEQQRRYDLAAEVPSLLAEAEGVILVLHEEDAALGRTWESTHPTRQALTSAARIVRKLSDALGPTT